MRQPLWFRRVWESLEEPPHVTGLFVIFYAAMIPTAVLLLLMHSPTLWVEVVTTVAFVVTTASGAAGVVTAWRGYRAEEKSVTILVKLAAILNVASCVLLYLTTPPSPYDLGFLALTLLGLLGVVILMCVRGHLIGNDLWAPGREPEIVHEVAARRAVIEHKTVDMPA